MEKNILMVTFMINQTFNDSLQRLASEIGVILSRKSEFLLDRTKKLGINALKSVVYSFKYI